MNAAASMDGARKIASDGELRETAAAGAGFIIDPSNRRWHAATCPRITAMSAGQPKRYVETSTALESFLEQQTLKLPGGLLALAGVLAAGAAISHAGTPRQPPPAVYSSDAPGPAARQGR